MIGFVLIALVLIGFSWWNQPSQAEMEAYQRQQDSIAAVEKDKQVKQKMAEAERKEQAEAAAKGDTTSLFYAALNGASQDIVLKNGKVELTFSTKGGTLTKTVIKDFADREGNPDVTLFNGKEQQLNYMLSAKESNIATQDLFFEPANVTDSAVTERILAEANQIIPVSECTFIADKALLYLSMIAPLVY